MINHQYYFGTKLSIFAIVAAAGNTHGSTWAVRPAHEKNRGKFRSSSSHESSPVETLNIEECVCVHGGGKVMQSCYF